MKLHVIFGQRIGRYEGQYAPEVIDCWDEYMVDENPEGFQQAIHNAQAKVPNDRIVDEFSCVRVIDIKIDGDKIERLMNQNPTVAGEIVE